MRAASYKSNPRIALLALAIVAFSFGHLAFADDQSDFFERKIRPVLVEHCYACHSSEAAESEGGLRVDTREAIRRGGESGAAVKPTDLGGSLLLDALRYDGLEMPPDQKLPNEVVRDFEEWIKRGAFDPRETHSGEVHQSESAAGIDFKKGQEFWSFQALAKQMPPKHRFGDWSISRIDDFVAATLAEQGLEPSRRAESHRLQRRLSFDLVGLPPTLAMMEQVEQVRTQDGIGQLVDQLIASDSFGEHWARMWLDIMRFADDQAHIVGSNSSLFFPNAYRYRDWVIQALNEDLPYDQFVRLQLAADLVTPDDPSDDVALGFMGLGPKYYRRNSPEVQADEWEDRVDVLSRGLLGLTVACARCHDHKYDPIGTADYYALAGVFASIEMYNKPIDESKDKDGKGHAKKPQDALHIIRDQSPKNLNIMIRGDVKRKGEEVPRGFLTVLGTSSGREVQPSRVAFQQGSGRMELAEQIVAPSNPLTARVIVNRVWARLIGNPLVGTKSNFGKLGDQPTHPELLDDLAYRFIENGWSLKWLCREIIMSATYQQTSLVAASEIDPENRLLAHMNRKQLTIEQWRDSLLLQAGRLDLQLTKEHLDPSSGGASRRTVYCDVSRLKLNPMLALFDFPDPNVHSDGRAKTITASQKLFLMNSPFMVEVATAIGERVARLAAEPEPRIQLAYQLMFARSPSPEEQRFGLEYLVEGGLATYVHALMLSNETYLLD
ncbi:MAG: PSD1 and planctomycete cytochrome C domain-containing protein [Planctomycetota bacterium]